MKHRTSVRIAAGIGLLAIVLGAILPGLSF